MLGKMEIIQWWERVGSNLFLGEDVACCTRRNENLPPVGARSKESPLLLSKRDAICKKTAVDDGTSDLAGLGIILELDEHHVDENGGPKLFIAALAKGGPAEKSGKFKPGGESRMPCSSKVSIPFLDACPKHVCRPLSFHRRLRCFPALV